MSLLGTLGTIYLLAISLSLLHPKIAGGFFFDGGVLDHFLHRIQCGVNLSWNGYMLLKVYGFSVHDLSVSNGAMDRYCKLIHYEPIDSYCLTCPPLLLHESGHASAFV